MRTHLFYLLLETALASLLLLSGKELSAQSVNELCQPEIVNYSKKVYNAYNQNWGATQDPKTGFMYFANSKGLVEFDGAHWTTYSLPGKQIVRAVAADAKGRIYTGGLGELGYWQASGSGRLTYHSLNTLIKDPKFGKEEIWKILVGKEGILFQSFSIIYLFKNNQIQIVSPPGNILFVHQVNERYLVEALDKGLYEFVNGSFNFLPESAFLGKSEVQVILPLGSKELLIGTNNQGLFAYRGTSFRPIASEASNFLKLYHLNRGIQLDDTTYAFGSILNGIILTNAQGRILKHLNQKNGLQNNTVLSMTTDGFGNLWAGLDKGIDLLVLSSKVNYFQDVDGKIGAVYDAVLFDNHLYLGTNHGVFYTNLSDGKDKRDFTLIKGTQGQVWDLEVVDGQLLCGHNAGTFAIQHQQAVPISTITGGWAVKKLSKHPDFLLQGTYTGLSVYRQDQQGHWVFSHVLPDFAGPAKALEEDEEGNIWVTHAFQGIYRIQLSDDLQRIVKKIQFGVAEGLPSASTLNLSVLGNTVLVCTDASVLAFDPKTQRFTPDRTTPEPWSAFPNPIKLFDLRESKVLILQKDGGLGLWRAGHEPAELYLNNVSWVDNYEKIVRIDAGHYLACYENGFAFINEQDFVQLHNTQSIRPVIRQVQVADAPNKTQQFRSAAPSTLHNEFTSRQNNLTFTFGTPVYGKRIKYSYRLENFSANWSPFSETPQKEYTNLPPGKYVFSVRNQLSDRAVSYAFEIAPPWYLSTWAVLLYCALAVGGIIFSIQLHYRRVEMHKEKVRRRLEKKIKKQEEEHQQLIVQHKNEKLEQDLLNKSEELANSMMNLIKKNELLLQIKEEVTKIKEDSEHKIPKENYHKLVRVIDANLSTHHDLKLFETNFNRIHEDFFKRLLAQHPDLTPSDLKLAAYLRMNLSSKEIAQLLNITTRGVELKRYRLRKRLNMPNDQNLLEFMIKF